MTIDLKDRLYTSSEVADILGVSLRSVYRYLEEGKLDADIKTATGRHRFSRKNILDFLRPSENQISSNNSSHTFEKDTDDVLDLPALSKTVSDKNDDDFDFDFDEEFLKNLEKTTDNQTLNKDENENSYSKVKGGDYQDDDLEKLLREFEEQENLKDQSEEEFPSKSSLNSATDNSISPDDELERLLKSLESSLGDDFNTDSSNSIKNNQNTTTKSEVFDDFDFDFDFNLGSESKDETINKQETESKPINHALNSASNSIADADEDSEDNWLERFRKAAEKNSVKKEEVTPAKEEPHFSNMFENTNLDVFFDSDTKKTVMEEVSIISNTKNTANSFENTAEIDESDDRYEYFYTSSLGGLKEIAQTADSIARKFDIDYAFTLNAGLSLHKPIAPFSIIHLYVREKDLELFEDYLKLNPSTEESASVCLITQDSNEVFRDVYELHGLNVVSNVQLRSDLIDKGLDKLAREI